MEHDSETIDVGAGMVWGAVAPALAGAILGLAGGPLAAIFIFGFALMITATHVVLLAVPLYGLLHLAGWRTGPGTALIAAPLIGAFPVGLWLGAGAGFWGGLFGLIGGGAFCAASIVRKEGDEA
jgi:hypothetical protein